MSTHYRTVHPEITTLNTTRENFVGSAPIVTVQKTTQSQQSDRQSQSQQPPPRPAQTQTQSSSSSNTLPAWAIAILSVFLAVIGMYFIWRVSSGIKKSPNPIVNLNYMRDGNPFERTY